MVLHQEMSLSVCLKVHTWNETSENFDVMSISDEDLEGSILQAELENL